MPGADHARAGAHVAPRRRPEAVVAVVALELVERLVRIVQAAAVVGLRGEAETHEILARERERIVEREVGHLRQPVVFQLAVADDAFTLGMVLRQRLKQELPVCADAGRTMFADVCQILGAVVEIRFGQHLAAEPDPLHAAHAVAGNAVGIPLRREGAAEAVHDLLHAGERQLVGEYLEREDHHVHVVEEMQVDVLDRQVDRRAVGAGHADERNVAAPIDADRRLAVAAQRAAAAPLAVEEALHVRQEGHEFTVVALLELRRVAGEFVLHLAPRVAGVDLVERLEMALHLVACAQRHQLQRPDEDLAEVPHHELAGRRVGHVRSSRREKTPPV